MPSISLGKIENKARTRVEHPPSSYSESEQEPYANEAERKKEEDELEERLRKMEIYRDKIVEEADKHWAKA